MADKTPVRVVFNASNVATGMAEFQSGETVPIANGGTGISSIGSAGQILKVNAAGNALEFGAEGDLSITNLVAPTNADLTFSTSGTGNIILDAITVNGTTLSAADSATITVAEALDVTGQLTFSGLALPTSDGTSGQVLQTDGSGSLSFASVSLGDLSIVGSSIASPSNADLTLDPAGSGSIKLNANTDITGNLTVSGTLDLNDSNFTNVGSLQLDSIAGDGDTNTSITFSGSDVITIATGGSGRLTIGDGALSPVTTNQIDLGTSSLEFKDAFFDGTVTTDALTVSATSTLADTNITGAATLTNTSTDDSLLITTTEDSNSAAPVVTLKRNSSSPANADYLGRIKFKGENDADQEVQYASISGKIIDVADGSEDGAVEFNVKKAGSNNIAARLNSTELKLLNGTTLDVDGAGTFAGSVTATSITTNDIASNGSNADINLSPAGTGKVVVGTDVTVADDVSLISDGAILNFGANSEISVTHVHDTGLLLTDSGGTPTLQLHDANESVSSDGSNLILTSGGTAFTLPTSDGSAGEFLKTDGAGTLTFGSAAATVSDDSRAVVKNNKSVGTSARTVDYFQSSGADVAWYFMALNDLTNDHSSASCFTVCHNDTDAFISGARGGASGSSNTLPTTSADISSSQVRVKIVAPSADSRRRCKAPLAGSSGVARFLRHCAN